MSFAPVVPLGGLVGWRFLQRTLDRQEAAHAEAPAARRDEAYFRERIGQVRTAADLVGDPRLLRVALTAFGLQEDQRNRAFITRVLESDTTSRTSFAARLADKRYLDLARAFGLGEPFGPAIQRPGQVEAVLQRAREIRFEVAVGAQNPDMRLALSLQRDLRQLAAQPASEGAKWFTVLGTPALRTVFDTAFNLPPAFAGLDLDRQVEVLQARLQRLTGSPDIGQFTDPARMDQLIRRFFVGSQLAQTQVGAPASPALALLQAAVVPRGLRPPG